jgi:hypothetical protein
MGGCMQRDSSHETMHVWVFGVNASLEVLLHGRI